MLLHLQSEEQLLTEKFIIQTLKPKKMPKISLNDFRLKLLCLATVFLFVMKFFRTGQFYPIFVNTLIEFSVFFIIYFVFKKIPAKSKLTKTLEASGYYFLFVFNFLLFFTTNYHFNDALAMKYSLYNLSMGEVGFFLDSILKLGVIAVSVAILIGIYLLAKFNFRKTSFRGRPILIASFIIIICSTIIYAPVNNAYVNTVHDVSNSLFKQSVPVEKQPVDFQTERPFSSYESYNLTNQRVLVFLMEQVDYKTFKNDLSKIPEEKNFFERINSSSHWYTNYYATNQDSRTSIWTMFSSQFLPFEAYISNWDNKYGYIVEEPDLVELFNHHNYTTKVAASMYDLTLLLGIYNWDKPIFLKQYPVEDKTCMHQLEYQKGCEDRALLDQVKKELHDDKQFLFQEMVFGHGEKYMEETGKTRTEYYNDYFNEIYSYLENNSMLENTTIIIASDHGQKGYFSKDVSDYQIPLIVYNQELEHEQFDSLYSLINFKEILLSYIGGEKPEPLNETFIIGQTSSNEIAYVNSKGDYFTGKLGSNLDILDYSLGLEKIKTKAGGLLAYKDIVANKSLKKNYYCKHCEKNEEMIKEAR